MFSQITAPRGSPLPHSGKACPPFPKSAVSLKRSVLNGDMRTHIHTASLTDSDARVRVSWREREEGGREGGKMRVGVEQTAIEGSLKKGKKSKGRKRTERGRKV